MRDDQAARLREGRRLVGTPGLTADDRITRRIEHAAGMTAVQHEGEVYEIWRKCARELVDFPVRDVPARVGTADGFIIRPVGKPIAAAMAGEKEAGDISGRGLPQHGRQCRKYGLTARILSVINVTLSASKTKASTRSWAQASPSGRASGNVTQSLRAL